MTKYTAGNKLPVFDKVKELLVQARDIAVPMKAQLQEVVAELKKERDRIATEQSARGAGEAARTGSTCVTGPAPTEGSGAGPKGR